MRQSLVALAVLAAGCHKAPPVPARPVEEFSARAGALEDRLDSFLEGGLVVSRDASGAAADEGDSLLFTGLALGVLPCGKLAPILAGLGRMQDHAAGYLVRFDPLPQHYIDEGNVVSRDGATGMLWGLQRAIARCHVGGDILERWREAVGSAERLHPQSTALITPSFRVVWDLKAPSEGAYLAYVAGLLVTAEAIVQGHTACYPLHLATLQNIILARAGRELDSADKDAWCRMTADTGLLLTSWYCGRDAAEIHSFLSNPADDTDMIYAHQRCRWEPADSAGKASPRLDWLVLYTMLQEGV